MTDTEPRSGQPRPRPPRVLPPRALTPQRPVPPRLTPPRVAPPRPAGPRFTPPRVAPAGARRATDPAPGEHPRRRLTSGLNAALWALVSGLVLLTLPVLLVWAADRRSGAGAGEALRTAGQLWLVGHGVPLALPGGRLGLSPLGLMVFPLAGLVRAGAHAARESHTTGLRDAAVLTLAVAGPYAVLTTIVAGLCRSAAVQPLPLPALLGGFALASLGAGCAIGRTSHLGTRGWARLGARTRRVAVATVAAVGTLLGSGALLVAASLAQHAGRVTDLASATGPGLVGAVALLVLGLVLLPNAVVWGVSYLVGTGFAVGVGTTVGPFATRLGAVPAFPLLGALPGHAPPPVLGAAFLLVPLLAGGLAGQLVARRLGPVSWPQAAGEAALVGPCVGAVLAVLAALSGGPLGGGRLAQVGPPSWQLGLAVALEVSVGAAALAATAVRRRS